MFNQPHIARQIAQQRQREMAAQASQWRLRRRLRAEATRPRAADAAARPNPSWQRRARAVLRALAQRPAFRRPAI
ncbi:MAG TPA: hypothetical protein VH637_07465 [Streptosporangiaceae bacterium]|jgi:hypothetical protein